MTQVASALGRSFMSPEAFAQECTTSDNYEVVADVISVAAALSVKVRSPAAYRKYVMEHVLNSAVRRAFYCRTPLDQFLIPLCDPATLAASGNIFPFLVELARHADCRARTACAVLPTIVRTVRTTPYLADACAFLTRVGEDEQTREMLQDPSLFEALGSRFDGSTARCIIAVVYASGALSFRDMVLPVVRNALHMLCVPDVGPGFFACLHLVECCAMRDAWKETLAPEVARWSSGGWHVAIGTLVGNLLEGTSVAFVLHLRRRNALASLVRRARGARDDDATWARVLALLTKQCPAWVALFTNERNAPQTKSECVCPITLDECVNPVVASDGHTYERDALLQYMVDSRDSPITRQPLALHLFDNLAVR